MKETRESLIAFWISRAKDSLESAIILSEKKSWNSVVNRLYYAAFYSGKAILFVKDMFPHTHSGIRSKFHEEFIKNT